MPSDKIFKTKLELLSPARNIEIAKEAILHGADAVYIGAPKFGARKKASNSIENIEELIDFAHIYRSKVYITLNTIIFDSEIKEVEKLCHDLYNIGVDALIIQDLGILRMKIPPIALHASTQCDIRTPGKARFLESLGFSQLVLARELSLDKIKEISSSVSIPVECFVHGALCVSYSGRCNASYYLKNRSANRGECAQICRLPFNLIDSAGHTLIRNKHLLSLKDLNLSDKIPDLIEAGVSSFKIEGRMKDMEYVKNITAFYSSILNNFIDNNKESYIRSSFGECSIKFKPDPHKSFNRGFTRYSLGESLNIACLDTPKSKGEPVKNVNQLNPGDGVSFFDSKGNYTGAYVNKVIGKNVIDSNKRKIDSSFKLYKTFDNQWNKLLNHSTAERKIALHISFDHKGISASDERGINVRLPILSPLQEASKEMDYEKEFKKLGNTAFYLDSYDGESMKWKFIPISEISKLRKQLIHWINIANLTTYPFEYRRKENFLVKFPYSKLDFRDNISNLLSQKLYNEHGIEVPEKSLECGKNKEDIVLMSSKYCILKETGLCGKKLQHPLYLQSGGNKLKLRFNCKDCEMEVISNNK